MCDAFVAAAHVATRVQVNVLVQPWQQLQPTRSSTIPTFPHTLLLALVLRRQSASAPVLPRVGGVFVLGGQ